MFYFFYKIIIFRLNKEKDDIRSAYVYFSFFYETVNSQLELANHISQRYEKHTCRPIKTHVQTKIINYVIVLNDYQQ